MRRPGGSLVTVPTHPCISTQSVMDSCLDAVAELVRFRRRPTTGALVTLRRPESALSRPYETFPGTAGRPPTKADSSATASKHESFTDCCADGTDDVVPSQVSPTVAASSAQLKNFEEFIHAVWGSGVATHFACLTTESSGQYVFQMEPRGWVGACLCLIWSR